MTAIELAAIASAAVPGLNVTAFGPEPDDTADFCSALLVDSDKRRWRVRSPRHAEASTRLETERQVLRAFPPAIRAELPFLLPTVAGTVRQGELTTFVYSHIAGRAATVDELATGSTAMALEIGAAIAAIHDLPHDLVTTYDLPSYTANEFRQRKLNELDQSATTGKIPPALLRRWEHAMEDVALWRFNACVVHGDLHEDNILLDGDQVTAVIGWTDLRVGDPADDFAWLVAVNDSTFVDSVMAAYAAARNETPDPHLLRRAALSAEFALAQWLVKGYAADSARMVEDAETMLRTLEADIAEHGGQPISVEATVVPAASAAPVNPAAPAHAAPLKQAGPASAAAAAKAGPAKAGPAKQADPASPVTSAVPVVAPAAVEKPSESAAENTGGSGADADGSAGETEPSSSADAASADETGEAETTEPADADAGSATEPATASLKVIPLHK
ncbi:macrolide 2'-phosphotransferase [Arthrobacter glacialis]|uniref:macrolide 2'-phosphotransferase n=1 Tax=Arthrobacter glacialis TaxID=1664 RepID=UPI000CD471A4|nr:macrolide 2'-phosphotransferase [Arthrobacter glacialis]POH58373.1 aminoglycoside phosphotransferase [Arthrobacter glacialis]